MFTRSCIAIQPRANLLPQLVIIESLLAIFAVQCVQAFLATLLIAGGCAAPASAVAFVNYVDQQGEVVDLVPLRQEIVPEHSACAGAVAIGDRMRGRR